MMTDELILMLDKFEAGTGKAPTKIICGEAAFEKLLREATDDWGADRYLEPNINRALDKLFAFNKIFYEMKKRYNLRTAKEWLETEYNGGFYLFERYYYGQWNTAVQKEEELADINEDDLMSVLNSGGFNAVA